jgi:hypothetical protein
VKGRVLGFGMLEGLASVPATSSAHGIVDGSVVICLVVDDT